MGAVLVQSKRMHLVEKGLLLGFMLYLLYQELFLLLKDVLRQVQLV